MANKIGMRFGKLTVLRLIGKKIIKNRERSFYKCQCDCGNTVIRETSSLIKNRMSSCGCFKAGVLNKKHGLWFYGNKLYGVWQSMKGRCYRKTTDRYKNYGARGIKVCDEWINNFESFYNWALNNGYKEGLTLDRIDVNGDYEPSNCRWISQNLQARNKTTNVFIEYNNETHCLKEWAEILNLNYKTLHKRIKDGWSIDRAFNHPVQRKI